MYTIQSGTSACPLKSLPQQKIVFEQLGKEVVQ